MKIEDVVDDKVLPQNAPQLPITDEKWFKEYMQTWLMTLDEDVVESWGHVSTMSTAEILQLIGDCGKTSTATALNAPFDAEVWRVSATAANKMAILSFYVELRYRAIENNLREMVVQDGTIETGQSNSARSGKSEGIGESDSSRDEETGGTTRGSTGSSTGSDGPSEQESRDSESRTGLAEVPKT